MKPSDRNLVIFLLLINSDHAIQVNNFEISKKPGVKIHNIAGYQDGITRMKTTSTQYSITLFVGSHLLTGYQALTFTNNQETSSSCRVKLLWLKKKLETSRISKEIEPLQQKGEEK